jgi:hypothetical protein
MKIIGLLLSGILMGFSSYLATHKDPPHVKAGLAVMHRLQRELVSQHGFALVAVDTAMMNCVELGGFGFQIREPHTLEEAQLLAIDCAETMIRAFNEDEKVRPYLIKHPFTVENISLSLIFEEKDGRDVRYPYPSVVLLCRGNFLGWYLEPGEREIRRDIPRESYESVKRRLLGDQPSNQRPGPGAGTSI